MAYRQSLRDLQERLAQRLTAAKSEAVTASWLAVEIRRQRYLFPLVQSGEIFSWSPLQVVPYTKAWFAGVVSLRGGLLGVVDLGCLLDASTHFPPAGERITPETRLVSLHAALGVNAVLWIDRLQGLRNASMFQDVVDTPAGAPAFCTRCLVDHQGLSWQELDLQILASQSEFLAIAG